jgi:hypothetical protein
VMRHLADLSIQGCYHYQNHAHNFEFYRPEPACQTNFTQSGRNPQELRPTEP